MKLKEKTRKKSVINITSLIDVLFLLLIFFMVSSTFREQPGMKLELPESKNVTTTELKEMNLHVQFDTENRTTLALNAESITLENLPTALAKLKEQQPDSPLVLKADKRIQHGLVVTIMDIARDCGISKIIIATKTKNLE